MWRSPPLTNAPAFEQRHTYRAGLLALALVAVLGFSSVPAFALGILYSVNSTSSTGDDPAPGDGICETAIGNGICTLRAAIEESNGHVGTDGIRFSIPTSDPGYNPQTDSFTIFVGLSPVSLTDSVNITGPGATKLTVTGSGFSRIFNITTTGTVNLTGLSLTSGRAPFQQSGGAIENAAGATVNVTSCVLMYNASDVGNDIGGGAIDNASSGGTVNVKSSTFTSNLVASASGSLTGQGGAILNKGTLTVADSTFERNDSALRGGAIFNSGVATIAGSLFRDNGSESGGAITNLSGTVTISNSTFYGNIAYRVGAGRSGTGGAIYNKATLNLTNSTLTENFAGQIGGGLVNDSTAGGATATVKSTLIANNFGNAHNYGTGSGSVQRAPDVYGPVVSQGFNLIGRSEGSSGFTASTDRKGTIASPLNPKFDGRGLRNNGGLTQTVALTAASPAVDRGTSASLVGTLTTDQRGAGFPRRVDKSVANASGGDGTDIGAYELQ